MVIELDVESPQVRVQTGILNRHDVGVGTGFVHVLVPVACGRDEGRTLNPIHACRILDVSSLIQFQSEQRVDARLRIGYEVECDRLVAVGKLASTGGNDAKHGPKRLRDGHGLGEILVPEEDAHAAALAGVRVVLRLLQLCHNGRAGIEGGGRRGSLPSGRLGRREAASR